MSESSLTEKLRGPIHTASGPELVPVWQGVIGRQRGGDECPSPQNTCYTRFAKLSPSLPKTVLPKPSALRLPTALSRLLWLLTALSLPLSLTLSLFLSPPWALKGHVGLVKQWVYTFPQMSIKGINQQSFSEATPWYWMSNSKYFEHR